jgi:hypothetical protein
MCVEGSRVASSSLCFARLRFQRRRSKLPLFERDVQSFKRELRQNTLPKVQMAISELEAGILSSFRKRETVSGW